MLEAAEFEVTLGLDSDISEMSKVLADSEDHVRDAEVALVVYIGRAVAFDGSTWLVPTGADADSMAELRPRLHPLALPLRIAQQAEATILVIDGSWPARFDGQLGLGVGSFHEMHGVAPGVAEITASGALIVSATPPAAKPGGAPAATVERDAGAADFAPRALAAVLGPEGDLAGTEAGLREALPAAHLAGTLAAGVDLAIPTEGERAEEASSGDAPRPRLLPPATPPISNANPTATTPMRRGAVSRKGRAAHSETGRSWRRFWPTSGRATSWSSGKMDRLARSLKQLLETVEGLEQRGIGIKSVTEATDTTTPGRRLVFTIFGALVEFERSIIRERTVAGLKAARARGRVGGRPRALGAIDITAALSLLANPEISVKEVAKRIGCSPATLYRYLPAAKADAREIRNATTS